MGLTDAVSRGSWQACWMLTKVGSLNLRHGGGRHLVAVGIHGEQPEGLASGGPACPAGPLVGGSLTDGGHNQGLHATAGIVAVLLDKARVYDKLHAHHGIVQARVGLADRYMVVKAWLLGASMRNAVLLQGAALLARATVDNNACLLCERLTSVRNRGICIDLAKNKRLRVAQCYGHSTDRHMTACTAQAHHLRAVMGHR